MRTLREIRPDSALIKVRPGGAAAYLTTPLLAFAAALPWLTHSASKGWLTPIALSLPICVALAFVRPRVRRVSLDATCTLRLAPSNEAEDPGYEVVLLRGSRVELLLRHPSLAVVVHDLGRILDAIAIPLESSSGIPERYLRSRGEGAKCELETVSVVGLSSASHQRAARAALGAVAFSFLVFGWSLLRAQSQVSALSVALPSVTVLMLAGFATWMNSKRSSVRVSSTGVATDEIALGRRRRVLTIPAHELLGAYVVERADVAVEVLFATTRGPKVVSLLGDAARRVAAAVGPMSSDTGAEEPAAAFSAAESSGGLEARGISGRAAESRREARRSVRPEVARARQS